MPDMRSLLLVLLPALASATLSFSLPYNSHMVLQSSPKQANVWGWTTTDQAVSLAISDGHVTQNLKATLAPFNASMWTWHALLPATPAGETPYTITASSAQGGSASIYDVLFGDVWVCSGQRRP